MKKKVYKIGGKLQGIIPVLILLILFGSIHTWLYSTHHNVSFFTMIFIIILFIILLCIVYRAFFVKVILEKNGFYHQTNPFNKRYFAYTDISEAWKNSEKYMDGSIMNYCSYKTTDGQIFKFLFWPSESNTVNILLKRIHKTSKKIDITNPNPSYQIDGKSSGITRCIMLFVLTIILAILTINQLQQYPHYSLPLTLFFILTTIFSLSILIVLVVRYFYFTVRINSQGFYFQSTPFNNLYYPYTTISSYQETLKEYHYRKNTHTLYIHSFIFTDQNNTTKKFIFDKSLYEHEIHILEQRIEKQQHTIDSTSFTYLDKKDNTIKYHKTKHKKRICIEILFLAMMSSMIIYFLKIEQYKDWIHSSGVILEIEKDPKNGNDSFLMYYRYNSNDQTYTGKTAYSSSSKDLIKNGTVEIWYNPDNPSASSLHKPSPGLYPLVPFLIGVPLTFAIVGITNFNKNRKREKIICAFPLQK